MSRGKMALAAAALAVVGMSGCCLPQGQGLFARWKNRGANGAQDCPCPPYMNGYGAEGWGGGAMPVSMPGGMGCPCTTMPTTGMPGGQDFIMPQPIPNGGFPMPPVPGAVTPPGNGTGPGPATPRPADPSDPASARKTNGIATSKPGLNP